MESTLADIDRDGWELDDAEAIHNESCSGLAVF